MSDAKRQRILVGMLEVVGSDGYEGTSVRSAIERAGVYRQAFYNLFSGKEECYLAAVDEEIEAIVGELSSAAGAESGWRTGLRAALAALLARIDTKPEIARALLIEVHAAGPAALERRTAALERAAHQIDLARAEATRDAPEIAAEAVVAGILAVLHSRLAAGRAEGFEALLPELVYLAVLPYFGPEIAAREMRGGG